MKEVKAKTVLSKDKSPKLYEVFVYLIVFAASVCVSFNAELFNDDFTYKQASVCGINEIIQFLKWHINNYNGRTLVHVLEMMILRFDFGFTLWKVLTGVMVCAFCFIATRITTNDKSDFSKATILAALCFFGSSTSILNKSVFWLSGSYNYFVPTMMLLVLILLVKYRPDSKWIFPICFLCGATTEQVGMMTFGFFTILFLENIVRTHKISIRYIFYCLISAIGYATVLLSPGTSLRVETQNQNGIKYFAENLIIILQENLFGNIRLLVFIVATTAFTSYWLIKYRKSSKLISKICIPGVVILWVLTAFNIALKGISLLNEVFNVNINFPNRVDMLIFVVWLLYVSVYFISFLSATVLIYIEKKDCFPFVFFVLGFGSLIMMFVAGKSAPRTCLPMLLLIILFEIYSGVNMLNDLSQTEWFAKNKKLFNTKRIEVATVALLLAISAVFIVDSVPNLYNTDEKWAGVEIKPLNSEELKEFTDYLEKDFERFYSDPNSGWNERRDILDFSKY